MNKEKKCPQCRKPIPKEDDAFKPFCSERCKLIDLAQWATEKYTIPVKDVSEETTQDKDNKGEK